MMRTGRGRDVTVKEISALGHWFLITRQLCLVYSPSVQPPVIVEYDTVLCLCDVLEQSWENLETVLEWGDFHLLRDGNNGYKVIKVYEPICMAALLGASKCPDLNGDFIQQRDNDYLISGGDEEQLKKLNSVLHKSTIPMISEYFGIFRIWVHPMVAEVAGCIKLREKGTLDEATAAKGSFGLYQCNDVYCLKRTCMLRES
uniref:RdRp catalytic domain-containing protein n=1 Tax=Trichuris muris TaxID=70415 RepID=A0A5S6QSM0_TRIMR